MDYIRALEEERKKILVFERELPLSLQLVTQAIESCRKVQQPSEEITSEGPVLEQFIPLRPSCSSSDEENIPRDDGGNRGGEKKPDWLRSVQLWNQQPEPRKDIVRRPIALNATRKGGAFHPFEREKAVLNPPAVAATVDAPASSTTENNNNNNNNNNNGGGGSGGEEKEKEGNSQRKARRCWSPELHRRFLHALQQLGGPHVATPKQIRELMKVDGLTNDEVKSHLQKYRLHSRRPTIPTVHGSGAINHQQPQIVLVGSIWVPPPEYTAAAAAQPAADATGTPLNSTVYSPVASVPAKASPQQKTNRSPTGPLNSQGRHEGDDNSDAAAERTNSDSSSSQTTTASPPF